MAIEHSAEITQAISQFEAAWADGAAPRLEEFIPREATDNAELVAELVAVDLERRLKAGEQIRVEAYLQQFPMLVDEPGHVVNLLVAEFQYRCRLTPGLAVDEYLERFPQYREQLLTQLAATEKTQIGSEQFVTQSMTPSTKEAADETADGLLGRMVEVGLVAEQTIETRRKSLPATAQQDQHLIDELLKQGDVTAWQLKQLRAGQKIFVLENGRYLLLDELGKGGMGAVYRARHVGLNRDVALKTIDPRQAKNKQLIGRFQREIAVCAKLQHEHIVQAYDMGCHENIYFLVLEYVAGADLSSIVKSDGPLPPDEVAAVGLQIAAALVYAHAQGVIHRDIKPHNILLSTDGIAKLLDMGLASNHADAGQAEALTSLTQTGMVLGTADYMPPEQAADLSKVDGRSDIYSLGATLYFLLTGRPPFPGGDMMSKMHRLANEEPAPIGQLRPDCPRELTDVIERMLAKRPEDRYQSAVELVQALQPLAAERIAGRHVMTRAVHTAAEADTGTPIAQTVAVTPFAVGTADTVATSMLRPRRQSSLGKWLMAAAIGLPVLIGIGIWAAMSGDGKRPGTDESGPATATGSVSPDLNKPPSEVRIIPREGHYAPGHVMSWSPDGRYFATARPDGDVRVWDPNELKTVSTYTGHRGEPVGVTFSPDAKTVASWDVFGELHLWKTHNGQFLQKVNATVPGNRNPTVRFSPAGDELALCTSKGLVRWSIADSRPIQLVTTHRCNRVLYSPTGRFLAGVAGGKTYVWDLHDPKAAEPQSEFPYQRISLPRYPCSDFVFVNETELALTGDGYVEIRNVESGALVRKLDVPRIRSGIGFAPDGSSLLLSTSESVIRVGLATGKMEEFDGSFGFIWNGSTNFISPGGARYVVTDVDGIGTGIRLHDLRDLSTRELPVVNLPPIGNFALLGRRYLHIASSDKDIVCVFDLATGTPIKRLNIVGQPYVTNDGRFLVVVESGSTQHVEALPMPGTEAAHEVYPAFENKPDFRPNSSRAGWFHDGDQYWRFSSDSKQVRFWDVRTGKVEQTVNSSDQDNRLYVMPGSRLFVWRQSVEGQPGGSFLLERMTTTTTEKTVSISLAGNPTLSLADLSADDHRILLKPYMTPRLYLFDTADGRQMKELLIPDDLSPKFSSGNNPSTELSPNGRYLLLYDRIYDLNEAAKRPVWQMAEHTHVFYRAALLGDERRVVMRMNDRIEVWDWRKNKKRLTIYLLPQEQWLLYNHETSHWNSSNFAFRFVECLYRDAKGKEEWLVPFVYEQRTGWENEPKKGGLVDLLDE